MLKGTRHLHNGFSSHHSRFTKKPLSSNIGIKMKPSMSLDDCNFFETLVCNKRFVSIIMEIMSDEYFRHDTLCLKLIDTSTDTDVHIDQLLVDEGIAEFVQ